MDIERSLKSQKSKKSKKEAKGPSQSNTTVDSKEVLSNRTSFMEPSIEIIRLGGSNAKKRREDLRKRKESGETSSGESDNSADGDDNVRKQLKKIQSEQHLELLMNPQFYLSAEERQRIEKAKYKMKKRFHRFFDRAMIRKNLEYFKIWKNQTEAAKNLAQEYQHVRKFLQTRDIYY